MTDSPISLPAGWRIAATGDDAALMLVDPGGRIIDTQPNTEDGLGSLAALAMARAIMGRRR